MPHAGGDSLSRHLQDNPADRIDVQTEDTGHLHTRGELGIHQLGHHQPSRGGVVWRPLEQRNRPQKDRVMPAVCITKQT